MYCEANKKQHILPKTALLDDHAFLFFLEADVSAHHLNADITGTARFSHAIASAPYAQ